MSQAQQINSGKRRYALGGALALTLAATLWSALSPDGDESLVQPVAGERRVPTPASAARKSAPAAAAASALVVTNWAAVERKAWEVPANSYFAAWAPPPPPPAPKQVAAPPAPPPEPVAPAFAYQLIGRLVEGDQATALLAGPVRSLAVKAGDVVDGQWRVDQVTERGLSLTWLPAKLNQTISFKPTP
ncbi:hypothetical protein LNV09_05895 [Paucibacter sp. B2R-40]|uniref:hypothetical protein n=1 Tax=Paucibacter sp. B2R-40 TaxID=2893554 RepID=UPI0021E46653|nr:hypothetical protein [Paucibacter sp. B2R-40]MCV2353693.1 hypothetical protein [Paucibacter sp. B2R-40]